MKTAYSYIRCSSKQQIKGDTKRRQLQWSADISARKGWLLDQSYKFHDLGISAHKGLNATKGKLGAFINAVEDGRIKRGSVLLLENLDRLSRNEIGQALPLFLNILNLGIEIVTRTPEMTFTKASVNDVGNIILAIIELSRAYSESAAKVQRGRDRWEEKRKQAKVNRTIATRTCPSWLEATPDRKRWIVKKGAANTVRWIFRQAIAGYGSPKITRMLQEKGIPAITRQGKWNTAFVEKLLRARTVLGEYQPTITGDGPRKSCGEPISDYYPAIVDEETFYRAAKAMASRRTHVGRKGHQINIFQRLLKTPDGGSYVINNKGEGRKIVPSAAFNGRAQWIAFPYAELEAAFVLWIPQIQPTEPTHDQEEREALEGKDAQLADKIAKVKSRIADTDDNETDEYLDVLDVLRKERKAVQDRLEEFKTREHTPARATFQQTIILANRLVKNSADNEIRERLQATIRQLVDSIVVTIHRTSRYNSAAVMEVHFATGEVRTLSVVSKGQGKWHECIMYDGNVDPLASRADQRKMWGEPVILSHGLTNLIRKGFRAAKAAAAS